ncbi:hypothetical protein M2137_000704 [Parabacteroides sp. PFB2-10]|nr:hypothetical protein [Parabacteroides sp. PFB2-10]
MLTLQMLTNANSREFVRKVPGVWQNSPAKISFCHFEINKKNDL